MGGLRAPPGVGADYFARLMTPPGLPGGPPGVSSAGPRSASLALPMQLPPAGHEALQRQLLYERERGLLSGLGGAAGGPGLAASQQLQQLQEQEYLR